MPAPARHARAFTLIELLVVISIIALLIGILLPALGAARESARDVKCLSNTRQIAVASYNYISSNDGRVPPAHSFPSSLGVVSVGSPIIDSAISNDVESIWSHLLVTRDYGLTREAMLCPSFDEKDLPRDQTVVEAPLVDDLSGPGGGEAAVRAWSHVDYGINRNLAMGTGNTTGPFGNPISGLVFGAPTPTIDQIREPSNTILALDTYIPAAGDGQQRGFYIIDGDQGANPEWPHARHGGGNVNIAYVDGHGASFQIDDQDEWYDSLPDKNQTRNPWDIE